MTSSTEDGAPKLGAVRVTFDVFPTGWPELLPAFFATVAARLEPNGPGSRFPALATLSTGELASARSAELRTELGVISDELGPLSIEDLETKERDPEWLVDGRFTTLRRRDLIELLVSATEVSEEANESITWFRDYLERV